MAGRAFKATGGQRRANTIEEEKGGAGDFRKVCGKSTRRAGRSEKSSGKASSRQHIAYGLVSGLASETPSRCVGSNCLRGKTIAS